MKHAALYLAVAAALAAGCASKETRTEAPVTDRTASAAPAPTAPATGSSAARPATQSQVTGNPLRDPNNILSKRSVFFDYDSNVVKDEYQSLVQAHSRYLSDKRDTRVRVEGNTDERGSREYNLALGQRRAEAVKKVMTVLGVPEARIETISFGEEKPRAPGSSEDAWSQNRRADIKYAGE